MRQWCREGPGGGGRSTDHRRGAPGLEAQRSTVDVAVTGPDGIWLASEGTYDAIVLDLMLPGYDGFEVCTQLRSSGNWSPILVLTGRDGERDLVAALDAGVDDYLKKPFSFPVLVARLYALARRGATRDPVPVSAGDLVLDPARRKVWRAGQPIELTARQFDVLACLMRHAGRVLSKADILHGVWNFDFEGDPNIVEVDVRRLRRRVDEPFDRHAIQTVRGAGYRVDPDGGLAACAASVGGSQLWPRARCSWYWSSRRVRSSPCSGPRHGPGSTTR